MKARVLSLCAVVALAAGVVPGQAVWVERRLTVAEQAERFGSAWQIQAPPSELGPEARAEWLVNEREVRGRTPAAWEDLAASLGRSSPVAAERADLAEAMLLLYAAVGVAGVDRAALASAVAGVAPDVRADLGGLVSLVAESYAAQAEVARAVATRVAGGYVPTDVALTPAERDATLARGETLVHAVEAFGAAVPSLDGPVFSDPLGLVIVGGDGNDVYPRRPGLLPDPVLLVDLGGNDRTETSAGGACPALAPNVGDVEGVCNRLALSIHADFGQGTDSYTYEGPPTPVHGAGAIGGLGILRDEGGRDRYDVTFVRGIDFSPFLYLDSGAQGFGYAGVGFMIDGGGDDLAVFRVSSPQGLGVYGFGQGFGAAGGVGVLVDGGGRDQWVARGIDYPGDDFMGLYVGGVGFYGGVGVMLEHGDAADSYSAEVTGTSVDFYAYGFGAFGGLGLLIEEGGNDSYWNSEVATDPWINPLLNCAYGTGSAGGTGIHVDRGGDDVYYGESHSPLKATVMNNGFGGPAVGYGLFVDEAGHDHYEMAAFGSDTMVIGMGVWEPGVNADIVNPIGDNTFGTFVDLGGDDTYVNGYGANGSVWNFGVDRG